MLNGRSCERDSLKGRCIAQLKRGAASGLYRHLAQVRLDCADPITVDERSIRIRLWLDLIIAVSRAGARHVRVQLARCRHSVRVSAAGAAPRSARRRVALDRGAALRRSDGRGPSEFRASCGSMADRMVATR